METVRVQQHDPPRIDTTAKSPFFHFPFIQNNTGQLQKINVSDFERRLDKVCSISKEQGEMENRNYVFDIFLDSWP